MKNVLCFLLVFFSISLYAQEKKDVSITTEVSEVTVFIKGAQVVRQKKADFPVGRSTLRFINLSPYIDAKSIQVKIDGNVTVLSVNQQLNYGDQVKQSQQQQDLLKKIEELDDGLILKNTQKQINQEELTFLNENRNISGRDQAVSFQNLKETANYYGERIASLRLKDMELNKQIKKLLDERQLLNLQLGGLSSVKREPVGEILVDIECKSLLRSVPVEISYYVNNASWYPSYDIRANSIDKPVLLAYKANIRQDTKEDWKNVKLKVSSVNPNVGNVAPLLQTYYLNYNTLPPKYDFARQFNEVKGTIRDPKRRTAYWSNSVDSGYNNRYCYRYKREIFFGGACGRWCIAGVIRRLQQSIKSYQQQ